MRPTAEPGVVIAPAECTLPSATTTLLVVVVVARLRLRTSRYAVGLLLLLVATSCY